LRAAVLPCLLDAEHAALTLDRPVNRRRRFTVNPARLANLHGRRVCIAITSGREYFILTDKFEAPTR
jgi:hypothetical protein